MVGGSKSFMDFLNATEYSLFFFTCLIISILQFFLMIDRILRVDKFINLEHTLYTIVYVYHEFFKPRFNLLQVLRKFNIFIRHKFSVVTGIFVEMSSTSSDITSISACFDNPIEYLEWLDKNRCSYGSKFTVPSLKLKVWVRLMKTLFLCARNRGSLGGDICFRIEELVRRNTQDLQSAYLTSGDDGAGRAVSRFLDDIRDFGMYPRMGLGLDILDEHCMVRVPDAARLMDLIDSLLDTLACVLCSGMLLQYDEPDTFKTLKEKLLFLKNFIAFVTMQGIEHVQLIELLLSFEYVAVKAARLIYMFWHDRDSFPAGAHLSSSSSVRYFCKICQLEQKFKPVDPRVRKTFIHVFTDLKLSRSSSEIPLALGKNWQIPAADILDSLLGALWDLLRFQTTGFIIYVKCQMQKLWDGVTFLKYLLREHQEKFNRLHEKMKDLIRIVVCDVGIVICSFSPNEMTEGLAKETNNALFHLLENLEIIMAEVSIFYPSLSFPRTNELGLIDFLLKNIKELASCETDSIAFLKDQIHRVQEDLAFLRSFVQSIAEQRKQDDRLQTLWGRVMEVAYKAEFVIDSLMVGDKPDCSSMPLGTITEEIECLKIEAHEIHDLMRHYSQPQRVTKEFVCMPSQVYTPALSEFLVDLDDELDAITCRLERGSKYLDIVSIVGMPGLGKTTMAKKVYHNPLIMHHFHIRAWCTVSQVHSKHSLLLQILHCIESPDKCLKMTEDDLAELLCRRLRGNRYLIVLDDVWDIDAWNSLKESFPEDVNGSRILFTSRFHNLSLQVKLDSKPHYIRPFTDEESWALLQNKLFGKEGCPPALSAVGMQIAKNCKGLPLTVAIVAGILATTEQDCWEDVANSLSLSTVIGTEHCKKTLELSYSHLPDYLKPCLLYFAAFPEDQVIPVRRLILLWISEGFVQQTEEKKLEDVADEYLMELIGRSLVTVSHQRTRGGVKACRIHDLLHEFCVAKGKEESFLQFFHGNNENFAFSRPYNPHRLCIYTLDFFKRRLFFPDLRCMLFFGHRGLFFDWEHPILALAMSKLLRVLDFGYDTCFLRFPEELVLLIHLRHLAIPCESIPSSISNLSMLETLILTRCGFNVALPNTIWKMKKLRHLRISRFWSYSVFGFMFHTDNLEVFPNLYDLDSFSLAIDPTSQSIQKIMLKLPSIRRLKCNYIPSDFSANNCKGIVVLDNLSRLETLHLSSFHGTEFAFPLNLKKLTLFHCPQPWSKISTIGKLPNLEVLKLLGESFMGETWEIKEGEFPSLAFLKLEGLDIVRWTASCDNFPPLQKVVLHNCRSLEEVPSCLGDVATIKMVEVRRCCKSVTSLVKQIQEEQVEMGNEDLKIITR